MGPPAAGILALSLWLGLSPWGEANSMRAPQTLRGSPVRAGQPQVSLPAGVFDRMLRFYQQVISQVDGARSNMYPTGSAYARQAFKKHGAFLGIFLTTERLLHEGNERQVSPRIRKYGIWRIHDPVAANDWWWGGADNWSYRPRLERNRQR